MRKNIDNYSQSIEYTKFTNDIFNFRNHIKNLIYQSNLGCTYLLYVKIIGNRINTIIKVILRDHNISPLIISIETLVHFNTTNNTTRLTGSCTHITTKVFAPIYSTALIIIFTLITYCSNHLATIMKI